MIEDKPTIQDIFILYSDNYIKNHNHYKDRVNIKYNKKNKNGKLVRIRFSETDKTAEDCLTNVLKNLYR